ncbi:MAG: indole-3-glycerol phosphate synthase TrpC [Pelotomaculum sp.]|uniref:Indole-3-glycerol phosphate synthase n=1 Tax=Pelotomaculum thermopropionicum (strain DSM 13744 / JCM 10971 / SI) TaxID=370438 RepID=A5D1S4_PELTS|nr:indole-3-glycerol phosphate synthase TrpC [Pelotomaculum sp.]BAF59806.1 indole-3-glycerol phosphate synthase [Pelotomaculum thermopropionicum SI]
MINKIIACKKADLAGQKKLLPVERLKELMTGNLPSRPLASALRRPGQVTIIAEVKRASPLKGILNKNLDPLRMAQEYGEAGAAAISVLTEERFFLGRPSDLVSVRSETALPVLRKDFIIDPYQIFESRVLGADAVLLIAAVLQGGQLAELKALADELGMSCLIEVHTEAELYRSLSAGAEIIGINNRDLGTFKTDLNKTLTLSKLIDGQKVTVVSESGIRSRNDIEMLKECGVHAALVGEALVCRPDPGRALKELKGCV